MIPKTLEWIGRANGHLRLLDQRRLPRTVEYLVCREPVHVFDAVRTLAVRGAPAIGVAAAYGLCLALGQLPDAAGARALQHLDKQARFLASARPTAVNLAWAVNRVLAAARLFTADVPDAGPAALGEALLAEARAIQREDELMCRRIGENGQHLIPDGGAVLTHCNAGALATAGIGTALAPMYVAHERARRFRVYADETRPLLQGARLTAWELQQAGIDVTIVCDNMAATLMKQDRVQAVLVGADRIAANGDTANKIGTCSLAVLARHFGIPFYVAAPSSTFDLAIRTGAEIPIEERAADEVLSCAGVPIGPDGIKACNPAFDVTDADLITAIITDRGVIERPSAASIARHLKDRRAE